LEHSITLSICLNDSVFYKCICLGIIANSCLFSGHRVVNETLESISIDLGFSGNTIAEGTLPIQEDNLLVFLFIQSLCLSPV